VAIRRVAPDLSRGGAVVPPSRARLSTGAGALAALALADVIVVAAGGRLAALEDAGAGLSLAALAAGLALRRAGSVPWAVLLAAAGYVLGRHDRSSVDGRAVLVGVLLLGAAELAYWSIGEHPRIRSERPVVIRRLVLLGGLLTCAFVVDVLLLAVSSLAVPRGAVLAAAGTAAAVAAVALVLRTGTHRP
jgi:hypothetical protein